MSKNKGGKKNTKMAAKAAGPGPLAAWRLSLAVACSGVITGRALLDAASTGQHLDLALGRSFGAACLMWIAAGKVNRMFVDVERRRIEELTRIEQTFIDDAEFESSSHDDSAHSRS
jgi:hypothetical protein